MISLVESRCTWLMRVSELCRANQVLPSFNLPAEVKPISTAESVAAQLKVIDGLSTGDNGKFYNYDGSILAF
jgi:hypothetical protein